MIMKEKLTEAFRKQQSDINYFVWKGKKIKEGSEFRQDVIKLVDASEAQLKEFYNYCQTMLYNDDKKSPGRYNVLNIITDQRMKCNAELCLRELEKRVENPVPRYTLNEHIPLVLIENKLSVKDLVFGNVSNISSEFSDIPLSLIIDGCLDKLGAFSRKHLTLSFILKQGLWLTPQEINDLTVKDEEGNVINRLDIVRERLNINENIEFKINSKGLSYAQLRAMLQLKDVKYSTMTTEQLKVLRNRILFNLEHKVRHHIEQWETRSEQIRQVAEIKGFKLK